MRFTRSLSVAVLVLGLLAAGCDRGGTGGPVSVPAPQTLVTLPSCGSLADTTVDLLQGYLDAVGELTLDELLDPAISAARFGSLDEASAALEIRAAELGCSSEDISAIVAERADGLRAATPLARQYLDLIFERIGLEPPAGEEG